MFIEPCKKLKVKYQQKNYRKKLVAQHHQEQRFQLHHRVVVDTLIKVKVMDHNKVTMDNIQDNQVNSNRTTHRHGHNTMHRLVADFARKL